MQYAEVTLPYDHAYLLPFSCVHIGDKNADIDRLKENIAWVHDNKNAVAELNGDILNCATRTSASSPHEQNLDLAQQIETATELFRPIKNKIVGCIDGNHESRIKDIAGYSPLSALCGNLGIPYYGTSVAITFHVGDKKPKRRNVKGWVSYTGYFHHTTGGGSMVGSKLNRTSKLRSLLCNADFYCSSHSHQLGVVPVESRWVDRTHKRIVRIRQLLIATGSYLKWDDGYAEKMQLEPAKLGSPRIRFEGRTRDLHASV